MWQVEFYESDKDVPVEKFIEKAIQYKKDYERRAHE